MNIIPRILAHKIKEMGSKFPIVAVTGPRQSGKSTLLRHLFPDYKYVSLEDLDMREFASSDPRGFIATYPSRTIIDEAQKVPSLFSYLQTRTDLTGETGMYMIAGSQNFMLMEAIDQSLAGRTAIMKLLPFSRQELHEAELLPPTIDQQIFKGAYPRIYSNDIDPNDYYPSYIQTYVEHDVRTLVNVSNLGMFLRFIRLCAGRIGQVFNRTSIATETGCSAATVDSWISVLEASYICYRLEPNFNNYNKRIIKSPKLYFYDTGLACSLLGITSPEQAATHYLRGGLFENMVVNQFIKNSLNRGIAPDLTYWRDSSGTEVDLIETKGGRQFGYEIKSGQTFFKDFFKGLKAWGAYSGTPANRRAVIYGGLSASQTSDGAVIPFASVYNFPFSS